jgi:hypothetical protein
MPFHPACFAIFCQVSQERLGKVDVEGLVQLRDSLARKGQESLLKRRHPDVKAGLEQVWCHNVGAEYLAANPVFIPGLSLLIESCLMSDKNFEVQSSPFFGHDESERSEKQNSADPFRHLSNELVHLVVEDLDTRDIAAARLASRAFRHLPISLWARLIKQDMPWLYEAWSLDPLPYTWSSKVHLAAAMELDQRAHETAISRHRWELERRRDIIQEEMPEIYSQWIQDEDPFSWPELDMSTREDDMLKVAPRPLPRRQTDWYQLYCAIKKNWNSLKGLQNRERIWGDINNIVDLMMEIQGSGLRTAGS